MTALPAGRELDRAVAEAMGLPSGECVCMECGATVDWNEKLGPHKRHISTYSTAFGPHTQPMLDWLQDQDVYPCLQDTGSGWSSEDDHGRWTQSGRKLPEDLARLVVAVAEARKEAGDA